MAYTPEQKEKQRIYNNKYKKKTNSSPKLKKQATKKQIKANAKYKHNKTPEQKQRDREYNTAYQSRRRAILRQFKENQLKAACEIAEELK